MKCQVLAAAPLPPETQFFEVGNIILSDKWYTVYPLRISTPNIEITKTENLLKSSRTTDTLSRMKKKVL